MLWQEHPRFEKDVRKRDSFGAKKVLDPSSHNSLPILERAIHCLSQLGIPKNQIFVPFSKLQPAIFKIIDLYILEFNKIMNQEKGVFSLFQNAFNKSETLSLHFFDASRFI